MSLVVLVGAVFLVVPWATLQIYRRSALLGNAVRVSQESLPFVQRELDFVRDRLGFDRPIDVYVTEHGESVATLTSYLGTHVLLLDSHLIADLQSDDKKSELRFLLGTFLGALKAKHLRLAPAFRAINSVKSLRVLNPLLNPYIRATRYSGDQIGYICSGDLQSTLAMMQRLLVGRELAPTLACAGLVSQAAQLREDRLPLVHEWFSREPHWMNRYLNVLAFAEQENPTELKRFRSNLDTTDDRLLETMLAGSPHRRKRGLGSTEDQRHQRRS